MRRASAAPLYDHSFICHPHNPTHFPLSSHDAHLCCIYVYYNTTVHDCILRTLCRASVQWALSVFIGFCLAGFHQKKVESARLNVLFLQASEGKGRGVINIAHEKRGLVRCFEKAGRGQGGPKEDKQLEGPKKGKMFGLPSQSIGSQIRSFHNTMPFTSFGLCCLSQKIYVAY